MSSEEIRDKFAEATSLMQLITTAQALKSAGEDEYVVNQRLSEARRNLMKSISNIPKIPKINVPQANEDAVTHISFQVQSLNSPVIKYDGMTYTI